jgi:hypothetical protein
MTDKNQKPLSDELMRRRAFARWENEGGATDQGHDNSTIKLLPASTPKRKPPMSAGNK